uniref:F-box associated domain-containing protein n=1 Tax=Tanacetum cinerariifolium TaxID=118510 RepID=A0A6L2MML7_TANCI|nr:hypothetical protein [Tanacetum cinerariifolium]
MNRKFIFVGVEVEKDVEKLKNEYGLDCARSADIRAATIKRWPNMYYRKPGLKHLARDVASLHMEKPMHVCRSNWDAQVLNDEQVEYASKLLAQMRCLSKSWNDLLSRPSIKSHLDYSKHNNEEIILVFYDSFTFDNSVPFTAHPTRYPNQELRSLLKIPVMPHYGGQGCYVIGSVNGLTCFYKRSDPTYDLYIWSPSLSAVLTLPPFAKPSPDTNERFDIFYRFCFDFQTDDYKVVKLIGRLKPPPDFNPDSRIYTLFGYISYVVNEWLPVEVYSMRKGSWEPVTQKVPSHVGHIDNDVEVCGDGHVHWVCKLAEMGNQKTILAYDLGLETFSEISLPADKNDNLYRYYVLGILGGKLCVMFNVTNGDSVVWILDKYGVAESWVKHHQFSV